MKNLSISYKRQGQDMNATLSGELVTTAAIQLKTILHTKVDPWDRLIIDLTKVTDVDTSGVNSLFQTSLRCVNKNAVMLLRCQKDHPVKNMLRLTHSEDQFDIEVV